jgi:hypothetical protein
MDGIVHYLRKQRKGWNANPILHIRPSCARVWSRAYHWHWRRHSHGQRLRSCVPHPFKWRARNSHAVYLSDLPLAIFKRCARFHTTKTAWERDKPL